MLGKAERVPGRPTVMAAARVMRDGAAVEACFAQSRGARATAMKVSPAPVVSTTGQGSAGSVTKPSPFAGMALWPRNFICLALCHPTFSKGRLHA